MADTRAIRRLVNDLANELYLLHAAWMIADDDDRRRKALYIGPKDHKRWKALLGRAELTRTPQEDSDRGR